MDEERLLVTGALFHDIGKVMQRALSETKRDFDHSDLSKFFFNKESTGFSFNETKDFLESLSFIVKNHHEKTLDQLNEVSNRRILAEILSEADNLSSIEREQEEIGGIAYLKSILARIKLPEKDKLKEGGFSYNFNPLEFGNRKAVIYPENPSTDSKEIEKEYKKHWDSFLKEFRKVISDTGKLLPDTLSFLFEKYFWCIPSAYFKTIPDISLYEHSKVTSAFAVSMYRYFRDTQSDLFNEKDPKKIRERIKNRNEKRYLFTVIDINGIQKFIYSISSKKALMSLKGRSMFVEILSNLITHRFLWDNKINLYETNIVYSGGGKSYLLLPITITGMSEIKEEIEEFLFKNFDGQLMVSIGKLETSGSDFEKEKINETWKNVLSNASKDRQRKFLTLITKDYEKFFGVEETGGYFDENGKGTERVICEICRKEIPITEVKILTSGDEEIKTCKDCNSFIEIGKELQNSKYAILSKSNKNLERALDLGNNTEKIFFDFSNNLPDQISGRTIVYNIDSTDLTFKAPKESERGFMLIGGRTEDKAKELDDFIENSEGIKRLGILKMDVDNLGRILIEGLEKGNTLSRISQISRSISLFFAGELNNILKEKITKDQPFSKFIYVIYAGGDDLFAVGSWDKISEFALEIRNKFKYYTCSNPSLTISAGISLIKNKYPISKGASFATIAEEHSKNYKEKGWIKDAITFLNETVCWSDFEIAKEIKKIIVEDYESSGKKSLLRKLNVIHSIYNKTKLDLEKKSELSESEIKLKARWSKWKWILAYNLGRSSNQNLRRLSDALIKDEFETADRVSKSTREIISYLNLPVIWADYLTR